MLMAIWTFVIVMSFVFLAGFVAFIYGFYAAISYTNLPEEEAKYDRDMQRLAKVGSWIIDKNPW